MGYDASARAALGVLIKDDQLYVEKKVRGCKHALPAKGKYCSECGSPTWVTEDSPVPGYDPEVDDEKLGELDLVATGSESDLLVLGFALADVNSGEKPFRVDTVNFHSAEYDMHYNRVKSVLEKAGLSELMSTFGLYVFLYESC